MTELSSVEAALFAFKRREQRFVLTRIAFAYALLSVALGAAFVGLAWPALQETFAWYLQVWRTTAEGGTPAAPPASVLTGILPYWLVVFALTMVLYAALEAACLRWMVRGEASALGLGFGADTWRVYAIYWLWLVMLVAFVAIIVTLYLGMQFIAGLNSATQVVALIAGAFAPLALFAFLILVAVRLAPASAISVARGRLTFFSAWGATRGWFWALLGAFVLVLAGYLVISTVLQTLARLPLGQVMYAPMQNVLTEPNIDVVIAEFTAAFSSPWVLAAIAVVMLTSMVAALVYYIAWFGVSARVAVAALQDGRITSRLTA